MTPFPKGHYTIDVLIAERERISKIHTPKFAKNAGKMTNKQLLALSGWLSRRSDGYR